MYIHTLFAFRKNKLFPHSKENSYKSDPVKPFDVNFGKPGQAWFAEECKECPSKFVSKTHSIVFSPILNRFRSRFRASYDEHAE